MSHLKIISDAALLFVILFSIGLGSHVLDTSSLQVTLTFTSAHKKIYIFTPQPLRVSDWVGGWTAGKVCPGCISETVRCMKLILGKYIG